MPYTPIVTPTDVAARLIVGNTREDHHLDFKRDPYGGTDRERRDCAADVAQFANASGGALVIGADERDHVLAGFEDVPNADDVVRRIDEVLKGNLEPVPPIQPHVIATGTEARIVVVNVPPSVALIARKSGEGYEFPFRAADSKRYMRLMEVEARMGGRERAAKLRLEQIGPDDRVFLDADFDGTNPDDWHVRSVTSDAVTLSKAALTAVVPLSYVDAVYRAGDHDTTTDWVVALSCFVQYIQNPGYVRIRKPRR